MTTFDDVIQSVVLLAQRWAGFPSLATAVIVRDIHGRARLALAPTTTVAADLATGLAADLEKALAGYFVGPILWTDAGGEQGRLANLLVDRAKAWPAPWPTVFEDVLGQDSVKQNVWRVLQRTISKHEWLAGQPASAPWPLNAKTPSIVAFYSFKGGVGRSTTLAIVASLLAERGGKVAVLDLDLEAPGIGDLLGATADLGVIDWIVDHCATGAASLARHSTLAPSPKLHGKVLVFPAGVLRWGYVEKLARLDFLGHGDEPASSPVAAALRALLSAVKREVAPEWILIDSRSGLHDLGGLSIHGLSHIDVLLSRSDPWSLRGLDIAVQALQSRRALDDMNVVVVHAMARRSQDPSAQEANDRFRDEVHDIFAKHVYDRREGANPPVEDDQEPHFPIAVPRTDALEWIGSIDAVDDATIHAEPFQALVRRIEELREPEEEEIP